MFPKKRLVGIETNENEIIGKNEIWILSFSDKDAINHYKRVMKNKLPQSLLERSKVIQVGKPKKEKKVMSMYKVGLNMPKYHDQEYIRMLDRHIVATSEEEAKRNFLTGMKDVWDGGIKKKEIRETVTVFEKIN